MAAAKARSKCLGYCVRHHQMAYLHYCLDCNKGLCKKCLNLPDHRGHIVEDIATVTKDRLKVIKEFVVKSNQDIIPRMADNAQKVNLIIKEENKLLKCTLDQIKDREKELIHQIRKQAAETSQQIADMIRANHHADNKFQQETAQTVQGLVGAIKKGTEAVRSNNNLHIIEVGNDLAQINFDNLTQMQIKTADFTSGALGVKDLIANFGHVEEKNLELLTPEDTDIYRTAFANRNDVFEELPPITGTVKVVPPPSRNGPLRTMSRLHSSSMAPLRLEKEHSSLTSLDDSGKLLDEAIISKSHDIDFHPQSIVVFSGRKPEVLWMHGFYNALVGVTCTANGNLRYRIIKVDVEISYISVHPRNGQLYCLSEKDNIHCVRTICQKTGRTSILFKTAEKPSCLFVKADCSIFVGFRTDCKVCLFSPDGKVAQTLNVPFPRHVTWSERVRKLAIACDDEGVIVLDEKFELIGTYMGPPKSNDKSEEELPFKSDYVEFDTAGRLLVADYENKRVDVVNSTTGATLRIISSEKMGHIVSLAIRKNKDLVVGTHEPYRILFVKYLE